MPSAAGADARGWLGPALMVVGAVTALRVLLLAFDRADLFVDEAQYWFWGQELAFGYYSKPPLIGWVIRAVTALAGSSAPFWVRLPGPLFHAATALILAAIAARLSGRRAAVWVAAGYVTLPMVALGSLLISTDTIMFPFLAAALLLWLRLGARPMAETAPALAAGALLGLAFLAKYAALYYLLCAALAALAVPALRPSRRAAGLAALAFAVTISPNILWNAVMGFPTLQHTADNIGWVRAPEARAGLHWDKLTAFVTGQFAVFGPLALVLLIGAVAGARRRAPAARVLVAFCLPILAIVVVQALLSRAYANWAAAAYLAGAVLAFTTGPGWARALAIAVNAAVCVALPLLTIWPEAVVMRDGRYALHRYIGRAAVSDWIIEKARAARLSRVVAGDRDVLADLFYTGRNSGLTFYAVPPQGRPRDHYELTHPLPAHTPGEVLFVASGTATAPCLAGHAPLAETTPATGAYRGHRLALYRLPADCWVP